MQEKVTNEVTREKGKSPLILNEKLQTVELNKNIWKNTQKTLDLFNYLVHIFLILIPKTDKGIVWQALSYSAGEGTNCYGLERSWQDVFLTFKILYFWLNNSNYRNALRKERFTCKNIHGILKAKKKKKEPKLSKTDTWINNNALIQRTTIQLSIM